MAPPPPGLEEAAPTASIGLLSGDTARELNGDDSVVLDGDGLRNPMPFRRWLLMVLAMVIRAACLARSVDTKLLTRSLRFPFTSGVTSNSKDSPPVLESLDSVGGSMVEYLSEALLSVAKEGPGEEGDVGDEGPAGDDMDRPNFGADDLALVAIEM